RRLYRLPYFHASIAFRRRGDRIVYECARDGGHAFSGEYGAAGDCFTAQPGSLEHFLTERYCLYAGDGGRLFRADIHHPPWPALLMAALALAATGLADPGGKGKAKGSKHARFSATITVPDNGTCGQPWATDTSKRTWTVKPSGNGMFRVTRRDKGTFVTLAAP